MLEEQLDYLRSQYQDRSNENTVLATANADYAKKVTELEIKASGEQARLKAINNDTLIKKYQDTVKQLRTVVKEREGTMQRMSEENARLREPRGRVGTRTSSIPRSPRAGTREPVSRQGSPSVQRPHPLRKEN
jgi:chromosome segregation ATPase